MEEFYEIIERKKKILNIKEKYKIINIKLICLFIIIDIILFISVNNYYNKIEIIKTTCPIISSTDYNFLGTTYVNTLEIMDVYNENKTTIQVPAKFLRLKLENLGNVMDCFGIKDFNKIELAIDNESVSYNATQYTIVKIFNSLLGKIFIFCLIFTLSMLFFLPLLFYIENKEKNEKEKLTV